MSLPTISEKTFSHGPILALGFLFMMSLLPAAQASAGSLEVKLVTQYDLIWNDSGSGADQDGSFWRPMPIEGWYRVGHHAKQGYEAPNEPTMVVRASDPDALAKPTSYSLVWKDTGTGATADGSIWHPVCPDGYQALGDVAQHGYEMPSVYEVVCVRTSDLVRATEGSLIWTDRGSGGDFDFSAWGVRFSNDYQSLGLFYGSNRYDRPSAGLFYAVK